MVTVTRTIIGREGEAPLSTPFTPAMVDVSPAADDDANNSTTNCASSHNNDNGHDNEDETVVMNSDDSSASGIDHPPPHFSEPPSCRGVLGSHRCHDRFDPAATTECTQDGVVRREEEYEPFLRIVEQEDIEVSAEAIVEDVRECEAAASIREQRIDVAIEEAAVNSGVMLQTTEEAFDDDMLQETNDVCIPAAEVEIEEEDVNTLVRDITPGVAQAVQQPNFREVDLERSGLSVSALTTTMALDEDVKLPAFPTQAALGCRASSGETADGNHQDQQLIFDDRTISAVDVAWAEEDTPPTAHLLNFKCQAREYEHATTPPPMPAPSPISSVQVSGGTSSHTTTHTDYTPTDIPVAPAVLVPDEDLAPEDRSPPQSTLTGDNNNNNNSNSLSLKSERSFWISIIVIALTLNSILVGGIVVGGFCAAGKCSAISAASSDNSISVMVPTPAPSRRLVASSTPMPTLAVESWPNETSLVIPQPGQPTAFLPPPPIGSPGMSNTSMAPTFTPPGFGISNINPNEDTGKDGNMTVAHNGDDDAVLAPSPGEANATMTGVDSEPGQVLSGGKSSGGIPLRLLLLIAILCESLIASILFCYYRHWRQRVLASRTVKNSTTPLVIDSQKEQQGQACDSFV